MKPEGLRQRIDNIPKLMEDNYDRAIANQILGYFKAELGKTIEEIKLMTKETTAPHVVYLTDVLKTLDSERISEDVPKAQDSERGEK